MALDIDFGGTGGGGQGPWINWQARESLDGSIPGRSWVIRTTDGSSMFGGFDKGVVVDIDRIKTGWSRSSGAKGVAPEWKWNASLSRFEQAPGDDWKRGISVPLAISKDETAVWEQAQAGAWSGFVGLIMAVKAANAPVGKLPVVKFVGAEKVESKKGLTYVPQFEIVKWVDRPGVLSAGADIATQPVEPTASAKPAASAPAHEDDEDLPF